MTCRQAMIWFTDWVAHARHSCRHWIDCVKTWPQVKPPIMRDMMSKRKHCTAWCELYRLTNYAACCSSMNCCLGPEKNMIIVPAAICSLYTVDVTVCTDISKAVLCLPAILAFNACANVLPHICRLISYRLLLFAS